MIKSNPSGTGVAGWPRGARLALFTVVLVLSILLMGAWAGGGDYVIATLCTKPEARALSVCSENGQALLVLLCFAPAGVTVASGGGFLVRMLGLNTVTSAPEEERAHEEHLSSWPEATELPFGQSLISGRAESIDAGRHRVTVGRLALRFWGGQRLRNGLIRDGDKVAFVYQRSGLFGLNYVLAFWKGGSSPIRSVGGIIHGAVLAIAIAGLIVIRALPGQDPAWLSPVCVILLAISAGYLILLVAARRALRGVVPIHDKKWPAR